ncbi:MAG: recombinase family protein [Bacteroidota bacterium]
MIPCYLYVRKSSEDLHKQIQSIESQKSVMRELAHSQGFRIVQTIMDEKSARKPHLRSGFNRLIELVQSGPVKTILTWKTDRLSRNPLESGIICQLLADGAIARIVTIEKTYLPSESQILFSLENAMASEYSRTLSINVKPGQQSKLAKGLYPACAPLGYRNCGTHKGNKYIDTDPVMFPRLQMLWQFLIAQKYQLADLYRLMEQNYPLHGRMRNGKYKPHCISFSSFHRIFRNPFYCGLFRWQGKLHVGNHKPMLSQSDFENVQQFLSQKPQTRQAANTFDFKGVFTCGCCGACITGERKRKKIKRTGVFKAFDYYKCTRKRRHTKCAEKPLAKKGVEQQLLKHLEKLHLPDEVIAFGKQELAKQKTVSDALDLGKIKALQQTQCRLEKDHAQVLDNLVLESDADIRALMKDKLRKLTIQIQDCKQQITTQNQLQAKQTKEIMQQLDMIHRGKTILTHGTKHQKQDLLRSIGRNWQLQAKTIDYQPFFLPRAIQKVKEKHPQLFPPSEPNKSLRKNKKLTSHEISFVWRRIWRAVSNFR